MGLRDLWATSVERVLERGRRKATEPRVFGIPVTHVPGLSRSPSAGVSPAGATGCADCGRTPRSDEDVAADWRVAPDGAGVLRVLCPECLQRELGLSGEAATPLL